MPATHSRRTPGRITTGERSSAMRSRAARARFCGNPTASTGITSGRFRTCRWKTSRPGLERSPTSSSAIRRATCGWSASPAQTARPRVRIGLRRGSRLRAEGPRSWARWATACSARFLPQPTRRPTQHGCTRCSPRSRPRAPRRSRWKFRLTDSTRVASTESRSMSRFSPTSRATISTTTPPWARTVRRRRGFFRGRVCASPSSTPTIPLVKA